MKNNSYFHFRAKTIPPVLKRSFVSLIIDGEAFIYNGIFAFAKGSNFLKFVIETVRTSYSEVANYNQLWISCRTGPIFFTSMFVSFLINIQTLKNSLFQLHFYDTRINMFDKDYLVTRSEKSIIYQVFLAPKGA